MSAGALADAARGLQGGQLDEAAVGIGVSVSVAPRQQPADRARVERQRIGVALTSAAVGGHLDAHDIAFGGERHADTRPRGAVAARCHATGCRHGHTQRVLQRQWIGSHRLHVVGDHHGTAHVPVFGMVLEQRQGSAHTVAGHQGLEIGVVTSRQLSQLLQQSVQAVGIHAQSGEHALVGNTRRIEERGDGRDRRHAIAERMCQPAKQIVMYREPARRPHVAAHV